MKLKSISIENFRGYQDKTTINFDDLTVLVGKNDIGKSTILEALDIFFNDGKGLIKLDKNDVNIHGRANNNNDIIISAIFSDIPNQVVIDETNVTQLDKEYLLNENGELNIEKTFKNGATTASAIKVCINAKHPSNADCNNLLLKKNADLKKNIETLDLSCDKTKNAEMRKAIWEHYNDNLQLENVKIDVSSKDGDIKSVWTKLQSYLPYYSLFQSDRKNSDGDDEVQDPLKEAVKQIMNDESLRDTLNGVAEKVREKLQEVSNLTLEKLKEMNPEIANSLHPNVPSTESLKWADVFKGLSISGDEDIPINKRGSGVKRLILLNFFRAEAERRKLASNNPSIIYAIEEPETSQHKEHQKLLISALKSLSKERNTQILLTTHSSDVVKSLDFSNLRLLLSSEQKTVINTVDANFLPYPSLNEVNYIAFNDASVEYHNELYGYIQLVAMEEDYKYSYEKEFDNWLISKGCCQSKKWIKKEKNGNEKTINFTLQTYIRNSIHHPENDKNAPYTEDELRNSIIKMTQIIADINSLL